MNIQELKLEKISDTLSVYQKENVFPDILQMHTGQ